MFDAVQLLDNRLYTGRRRHEKEYVLARMA